MAFTFPPRMSLEEKIGQMLVIGFPAGEEGLEHLRRAVDEFAVGNFILFSRNIGKPKELFELVSRAREIVMARLGIPPLVSIDQEGGIVRRIRDGVTPIPGAMAQAAALENGKRGLEDIRRLGRICGTELAAFGINWNLAPVVDINIDPANPVIGIRSYGDNAERVAERASAFAVGLAEAGIMATAKHFPGHGDTKLDSHLSLPRIEHDLDRLDSIELVPFKRLISEGVGAIMTAHVVFPALETNGLPATLSRNVVEGLLRHRLGFDGIVTTDCMEMRAITDNFPEAAVLAVEAGVDIVEISHTYDRQFATARDIAEAVNGGRIDYSRLDVSLNRIEKAKAKLVEPPSAWEEAKRLVALPDSLAFARGLYRDSLSLLRPGEGFPPRGNFLYVDVVPGKTFGAEDAPSTASPRAWMSDILNSTSSERALAIAVSMDPEDSEISLILSLVSGRDVVLGLYDLARHPTQTRLALKLASYCSSLGTTLSFVSMRSPYDIDIIGESLSRESVRAPHAFLCAYEYSEEAARAVINCLLGET